MEYFNSKYFKLKELVSPEGITYYKESKKLPVQSYAVQGLNDWREFIGVPISVNFAQHLRRGFRTKKENKEVKGAPNSMHLKGIAFDQTPHNYPLLDFYVSAIYWSYLRYCAGLTAFGALGIYPQNNFMHGDFRINQQNIIVLWNGYKSTLLTKVIKFDTIPLDQLDTWIVDQLGLPNWKLSRFTINELLRRTL